MENGLPPWPWRSEPKGTIIRRFEEAAVGLYAMTSDHNRRVYRKNAEGQSVGGPIGRYYWAPVEIIGETKTSWLLQNWRDGESYPKKPSDARPKRFYGLDEVEDMIWMDHHASRIGDHVKRIKDVGLLQRIAALTGYQAST